jgi:hypothetical protein
MTLSPSDNLGDSKESPFFMLFKTFCYFIFEVIKMSNSKILDYVMRTPGNTNRTILAQMIDSETSGVLEAAKAYTDSQRLAYEERDVYAYDESKVFLFSRFPDEGEAFASWISPNIISLEQIVGGEFIVDRNGEIIKSVIKKENIDYSGASLTYIETYIDPEISSYPLFTVIPTLSALEMYNTMVDDMIESGIEADKLSEVGLYLIRNNFFDDRPDGKTKTVSITANIVHKINSKFLPSLSDNYDIIVTYSRYNRKFVFEKGNYLTLLQIVKEGSVPNMLFKV